MLGLKLNHVSKRGHISSQCLPFYWPWRLCKQSITMYSMKKQLRAVVGTVFNISSNKTRLRYATVTSVSVSITLFLLRSDEHPDPTPNPYPDTHTHTFVLRQEKHFVYPVLPKLAFGDEVYIYVMQSCILPRPSVWRLMISLMWTTNWAAPNGLNDHSHAMHVHTYAVGSAAWL